VVVRKLKSGTLAESRRIGALLAAMTVEVSGGLAWIAENLHRPTADLMVGGGGVLHFLLRLENPYELAPPLLAPLRAVGPARLCADGRRLPI